MNTVQLLGLPIPSYYILRAVVKGVRLFVHQGHVEMDCAIDPSDEVVASLKARGFLSREGDDYLPTPTGRALVASMVFAPPALSAP